MADNSKIAKNMKAFREGIADHDSRNPDHNAWGIGLSHFDLERLGFEEGEELWSGIVVVTDGGQSMTFRVLCSSCNDDPEIEEEISVRMASSDVVIAIGSES